MILKKIMLSICFLMITILYGCMADLVTVKPIGNDDPTGFCQLDKEGGLIVSVKNQGNAAAASSITEVEFSPGGSFLLQTPAIPAGVTVNLSALNIAGGCYNPDCDFKITVDSKSQVSESNEKNNSVEGKCHRDPHIVEGGADLKEDPELLSPPIVDEPLYTCGRTVVVKGFIPNATIEIYADGAVIGGDVSSSPSGQVFKVAPSLSKGQKITAKQTFDGKTSGPSSEVIVKDHTEDYPNGVPRPYIDPVPLYNCGKATGVRNIVQGAHLQVFSETPIPAGGFTQKAVVGNVSSSGSAQSISINPEFKTDNRITAQYFVCENENPPLKEESSVSMPQTVVDAPSVIPAPTVDALYEQSEKVVVRNILNGASLKVFADGALIGGQATGGGTGQQVRINPPATAGQTVTATQALCSSSPPSIGTTVKPCSELPAPKIKAPEAGDSIVEVTEFVDGSRIIIFADGVEVGDGGGDLIVLYRPLRVGELVQVVQRLGMCQSKWIYQIPVVCKLPDAISNPSGSGTYQVGSLDYYEPAVMINNDSVRIWGTVRYPATSDGANAVLAGTKEKFPLIVFLHGNHGIFRTNNTDVCSAPAGTPEVKNHEGYNYVLDSLAKGGFIAVSINANDLNCKNDRIPERSTLILKHLALWKKLADSSLPDPLFDGKFHDRVDLGKIGLAGHSRGGEAVVSAALANTDPALVIKSVLSIAPVDFYGNTLSDIPVLMLLPAADGDVSDNSGARIYDRAQKVVSPEWFKSQMYVYGANHNFFNRQWLNDEGMGPDRLTRWQQEAMLKGWSRTFFDLTLGSGSKYLQVFTGDKQLTGIQNTVVYPSYQDANVRIVDNYEDSPDDAAKNSLSGKVTHGGFITFDEYVFRQATADRYNGSFYHYTDGIVTTWNDSKAAFESEIPAAYTDNSAYNYVSLRVAQVSDRLNSPSRAMKFKVGLMDGNGPPVYVDTSHIGVIPFPYAHPYGPKTMMRTLRVPIACFTDNVAGKIDPSKLKELQVVVDEMPAGALAIDQIEFSE